MGEIYFIKHVKDKTMEQEIIVKEVVYIGKYKILLKFDNDEFRIIDLRNWLNKDLKSFSEIKNEKYFRRFKIKFGSIAWPNGYDASPEYLYKKSKPAIIKVAS